MKSLIYILEIIYKTDRLKPQLFNIFIVRCLTTPTGTTLQFLLKEAPSQKNLANFWQTNLEKKQNSSVN